MQILKIVLGISFISALFSWIKKRAKKDNHKKYHHRPSGKKSVFYTPGIKKTTPEKQDKYEGLNDGMG
ncbi:MAG: hypothetical protein GY730_05655 [bacterium]|nr:hypothetical protein [bacterium]